MRVLTTTECQSLNGGSLTLIEYYAFDDALLLGTMIGFACSFGIGVIARSRYNNPNNPPISLTEVAQCTVMTGLKYCLVGGGIDLIRLASNQACKSILG